MAIRASHAQLIDSLVRDLAGASPVAREAAIARLRVIGARAVERLVTLVASDAPRTARAGALRALEGIGDPRALDTALETAGDSDADVASAAVSLARTFMRGTRGARAVDRLTAIALDAGRPSSVRVAAVRALRDLAPKTVAPLMRKLSADADAGVRAELPSASGRKRSMLRADPIEVLTQAADGALPDDATRVREAIGQAGGDVPLPVLLRIVERVREREGALAAERRAEWTNVRGAAHLALAERGSRIAVYDLRESLAGRHISLPADAISALSLVGDASCLDALTAAYTRSPDRGQTERLAVAFRAIVKREKLTRRHAVVRALEKRWKTAFAKLWA